MLLSVVELRAHNWGRKEGEGTDVTQNGTQQTPSDSAPSVRSIITIFFGECLLLQC